MTGSAQVIRGNALDLPLPDSSVDLIVTSPPYFALRSYQDNGEHYSGQLGSEATPAEFVDALIAATAEMVRVLKPSGSIWVNLGDKYTGGGGSAVAYVEGGDLYNRSGQVATGGNTYGLRAKSLIGIPWRYAIRCIDDLGLILRAEVIWSKPNGLPESVTDRVRRSHEQWFHFTKEPRYFAAVDEIREAYSERVVDRQRYSGRDIAVSGGYAGTGLNADGGRGILGLGHNGMSPLGKLPGSVWTIATQPLKVPAELGIDHFAAFPMEWPRRIILGWSPSGVCVECGEGRRPVTEAEPITPKPFAAQQRERYIAPGGTRTQALGYPAADRGRRITGYACACTPTHIEIDETPCRDCDGEGCRDYEDSDEISCEPRRRDVLVYDWHLWDAAPTTPAVVLDPFGGTGTTATVAKALGRTPGISVDMSADYSRLAQWRTNDPDELAKAAQVDKPPREADGQLGFDFETETLTRVETPPARTCPDCGFRNNLSNRRNCEKCGAGKVSA